MYTETYSGLGFIALKNSDALRIGIIGTGMMGCEHIKNVLANPQAVVTAISDPNDEPLKWAERTLGEDFAGVSVFRDHQALLNAGVVDAVVVASPNFTHHSLLKDILSTDIPVMVEKPMCTTVDDCLDVVQRANNRKAITWVGLEYRYMAPIAALGNVVASGELGDLKMMSIREHRFPFLKKVNDWNRFTKNTGGTLVEKCCHFFDLMNLTIGARPVKVYASGGQDVNHLDEVYNGEASDILDNAFVIVDYDNGVRAMLDLSMFAEVGRNEQEIVVLGSDAKAEAHIPGAGVIYIGNRRRRELREIPVSVDATVGYLGHHHGASYIEIEKFRQAVVNGAQPEVNVHDGLWSVVIGAAAHRSIDEGRPVIISEYGLS
jgi:myo-inositol 2-dehydrogenase / D-chiro-inositol 1-dehydrogenase